MELDFSRLQNIEKNKAIERRNLKVKGDLDPIHGESEKPIKSQINAIKSEPKETPVYTSLNQKKEAIKREKEVFREEKARIYKAEDVRTDILKGIKKGVSIEKLFIKAIDYISLTTGDTAFKTQAEKELTEVYGIVLGNKEYIEGEIIATENRLERLREAVKTESDPRAQSRIKNAIKGHESYIFELTDKLRTKKN